MVPEPKDHATQQFMSQPSFKIQPAFFLKNTQPWMPNQKKEKKRLLEGFKPNLPVSFTLECCYIHDACMIIYAILETPIRTYEFSTVTHWGLDDDDVANMDSLSQEFQPYMLDFNVIGKKYPWLYSLLNQCNIPVVDAAFMDCAPPLAFLPTIDQSLEQAIAIKLVAAKNAGYLQ
ncbi:sacsin isoform X1 [Tanacetum coccineum]